MYTTILVGTDGSGPAQQAIIAAAEIARRFEIETIHVVTGYRPISSAEMISLSHELPEEFLSTLSADAPGRTVVDEAKHDLESMGLTVHTHSVPHSGADAILDVAEHIGADLIVVGSHGYGVGRRLLRGSVSTKVAHHADCSVLIVHVPHDAEDESP
jgi:nucleotide-binding universal stress UspA family protein